MPVRTPSPGDTGCNFDSGNDGQFDQYRFVADGLAFEASRLAAGRCRPLEEIVASPLRLSLGLCRECFRCLYAGRLGLVVAGCASGSGDCDTVGEVDAFAEVSPPAPRGRRWSASREPGSSCRPVEECVHADVLDQGACGGCCLPPLYFRDTSDFCP